jgi:DNA-binding response OmpR family regulator
VVERDTLMREIMWYGNYLYDRTIDTHIKNLLKKIPSSIVIQTIRWVGYIISKHA